MGAEGWWRQRWVSVAVRQLLNRPGDVEYEELELGNCATGGAHFKCRSLSQI